MREKALKIRAFLLVNPEMGIIVTKAQLKLEGAGYRK